MCYAIGMAEHKLNSSRMTAREFLNIRDGQQDFVQGDFRQDGRSYSRFIPLFCLYRW
ncbi:MAG: hypothetical protein IPQ05_14630 [Leptospiraceae bacterium]|nr:hypothetical protein [Leptospiraceae bacterium]